MMVEASAGSGKTEALARRYVWLALAGEGRVPHADISSILAITFTRKAAREMKERVLDLLKKLAFRSDERFFKETVEELGTKPDELQAAATAMIDEIIDRYSDFQIQTIDSFMYRVARSAALELDLSPDFEITETYGDLVDYAMSLLLRRVGPGRDSDITRLVDEFMLLLNQVGNGSFKWRPEQDMEDMFHRFLGTEAKETGDLAFEDHRSRMEECRDEISRLHEKMKSAGLPLDLEYMGKLENHLKQFKLSELFKKQYTLKTAPFSDKDISTDQESLLVDARNDWLYLGQKIGDLARHHSLSRYHAYGGVYREFKRLLELVKSREGVLHIDDMRKTLNRHLSEQVVPDLYIRLGQRLYHFLIDEFQDTDPVQWASLYQLITESLAQGGSLYLVGDLKQAIYMFRNADYRVMRDMILDIRGENAQPVWLPASVSGSAWLERLESNYRSAEVILEYVNTVFKSRLKSELGKGAFEQDLTGLTDFVQHPISAKKGKGYVRTILFDKDRGRSDDGEPDPRRKALLEIISDLLRRNFRYSDIAVLAATNAELVTMVDWLVAARVPASSSSSLDIRNRKVVAELIELLRFLESPVDDLAFASFILGDIMLSTAACRGLEFDRDRFHRLLLGERRDAEYLYQAFRRDEKFAKIWEECFESLYQKTGYYPLYDLTSLALGNFSVFENFPAETGSLVRLLEVVNGLESEGRNSIRDFLECAEEDQSDLFALELAEYADAVRLMTFHKAKGLGFPVVINMISSRRGYPEALYYDKSADKIRVHYITKEMAGKNDHLGRIYELKRTDELIQKLNSLYVVCTRAGWELYNLVSLEKKESLLHRLFEECEIGAKVTRPVAESVPAPATHVELGRGDSPGTDHPKEGHWSYARWLDAARGDLFHRILGEIEYLGDRYAEEIEAVVRRSLALTSIPFDRSEILSQVETFVSRPEVRAWFERVSDRRVLRERDFVDRCGNLRRMDRVVVDRHSVAVIDYKTGEPQDYSDQLKTYMEILRLVYPEKEIMGYVAYIESGTLEKVK